MLKYIMERKYNKNLLSIARNLRKNMTKEERRLWYEFLRTYPIPFQKQKIWCRYVLDFYCAKAKLVIELDGSQHFEEQGVEHDKERTAFLEQYDLMVIRIPNNLINQDFRAVCEHIDNVVKQRIGNN